VYESGIQLESGLPRDRVAAPINGGARHEDVTVVSGTASSRPASGPESTVSPTEVTPPARGWKWRTPGAHWPKPLTANAAASRRCEADTIRRVYAALLLWHPDTR